MNWSWTNSGGTAGPNSYNDACKGGVVYLKNLSLYSGTNPASGSGHYEAYYQVGNGTPYYIGQIAASAWPINGVWALTLNGSANNANYVVDGLNLNVAFYGAQTYANNGTGEYMHNYLYTHGPTVNAGSDVITCAGSAVNLTASGASSYVWTPGGSSSNPYSVAPSSTTTYTATGSSTYSSGVSFSLTTSLTCSSTDQVVVNVNPLPVPASWTPNYYVCTRGALPTLNAAPASGSYTYQWYFTAEGGSTSTILPETTATLSTSPYGRGTYHVLITNSVTGCSKSYFAIVSLDPSAAANLDASFSLNAVPGTSSVTFSPSPVMTSGVNHTWTVEQWTDGTYSSSMGVVCSSSSATFSCTASPRTGYYTIKHTISASPCNELKTVTVQYHLTAKGAAQTKSVTEETDAEALNADASEVTIYPNPNSGKFSIAVPSEERSIEVYDLTGKRIFETTVAAGVTEVDLSPVSSGSYLIMKVTGPSGTEFKRIMVSGK